MNVPLIRSLAIPAIAGLLSAAAAATPVPRIIGGSDANNGEYPFMAALVQPASAGPLYSSDYQAQFCGGTVIGARWILTAAHCVEGINNTDVQVITGVTTLADTPPFATRTDVAAILPHPLFSEDRLANDIALLYLATPVAAGSGFVIDDGTALAGLVDGADLAAIGWGITDQGVISDPNDDQFRATLQETVLDYVPFGRCNSSTFYAGSLHVSALCAGFSSGTPRDTCFGDSGGPLMLATGAGQWRQLGVTSYGASSTCAKMTEPGVYVNIGRYHGFISGARSQPDLRTSIATVGGSVDGIKVRTRIISGNASPANGATAATLTVSVRGDTGITDASDFAGCTRAGSGAGDNAITTYTCTLGAVAANSSSGRDLSLELYGGGTHTVSAAITSTSGDYYAQNNNALRDYTPGRPNPTPEEDGGSLPPPALTALLLLLLRRRHAPHHSLRLRQLLRLG